MQEAVNKDKSYNEFFQNMKALIRTLSLSESQKWRPEEFKLKEFLYEKRRQIDLHFKNNFDFPSVISEIDEIIKATNIYVK